VGTVSAEEKKLKFAIKRSLRDQGFHLHGNRLNFRQRKDKRSIRKRHKRAVAKRILLAKPSLQKSEGGYEQGRHYRDDAECRPYQKGRKSSYRSDGIFVRMIRISSKMLGDTSAQKG
jgi:hypothetical protein